jgi:hypothetical protein
MGLFKCGGHLHERLILTRSGASGSPITIGAYGSGPAPTFDGTGVTMTNYSGMVHIAGTIGSPLSDFVIKNIKVQYAGQDTSHPYQGMFFHHVNNLRITECETNDVVDSGIMLLEVNNFEIDNNLVKNSAHCTENMDESISLSSCTDGLVYDNEVHSADIDPYNGNSIGICAKETSARIYIYDNHVHDMDSTGIYPCGWNTTLEDIYVYNNKIHDCVYGVAINSEDGGLVQRIYAYNNLIYRINKVGIAIDSTLLDGVRKDIYIYNNTVAKSLETYYSAVGVSTSNFQGTILIRNNCLFWHDANLGADTMLGQMRIKTAALAKMTISNNIVYGEDDYQTDPGDGMPEADNNGEETWADPLFTDWANDDYSLQSGSPCRDAGTLTGLPIVPATDYLGNTRQCGAAIDVGCYEYQE